MIVRLGWLEAGIVIAIVLLIFGPRHLPGLAKSLKDTAKGFKNSFGGNDEEQD